MTTKTIQNIHPSYNLMFKAGYITLAPGQFQEVTALDISSGMFEQAIAIGHLKMFDSPTQVQSYVPAAVKPQPSEVAVSQGMSDTELRQFLKQKEDDLKSKEEKTTVQGITVTQLGVPEVKTPEVKIQDEEDKPVVDETPGIPAVGKKRGKAAQATQATGETPTDATPEA